jgi:hypothetical protein
MQIVDLCGALGSQREAERRQGAAPPPAEGAPAQTALLHVGAVQSPELVRRPQTASQVVLTLPKQLFCEEVMHALDGTAAVCKPHGRRPPISRHAATHLSGVDAAA